MPAYRPSCHGHAAPCQRRLGSGAARVLDDSPIVTVLILVVVSLLVQATYRSTLRNSECISLRLDEAAECLDNSRIELRAASALELVERRLHGARATI